MAELLRGARLVSTRAPTPHTQLQIRFPATTLPSLIRTIETDVCVVGAGLIGLVHAHEARRRGMSVVLLERDPRAMGASVRDVGHLFLSAATGREGLDVVPSARERWLELTRRAGLTVAEAGTLLLAHNGDELELMEAFAATPARGARMLTVAETRALAPIAPRRLVGGVHASQDMRLDPRAATRALARLLARDPGARIEWGAPVHEVGPGEVRSGMLRVRAGGVVICPGSLHRALPPELWSSQDRALEHSLTQMLRVAAPTGRRYRPTLADATCLLNHPDMAAGAEAEAVRRRLELERPEMVESGVQLVLGQLPDGDLLVGESRVGTEVPQPFAAERRYRLLLEAAGDVLGMPPVVRQRWQATQLGLRVDDPRDFFTSAPLPGVRVVHGVSRSALALAPVLAAGVLDDLLGSRSLSDIENADVPEILLTDERRRSGLRDHAEAFRLRPATRA